MRPLGVAYVAVAVAVVLAARSGAEPRLPRSGLSRFVGVGAAWLAAALAVLLPAIMPVPSFAPR